MKKREVTLPEIAMIAGTRMALGAGLGLLLGERLDGNTRRGAGWALLAIGAISTIGMLTNATDQSSANAFAGIDIYEIELTFERLMPTTHHGILPPALKY